MMLRAILVLLALAAPASASEWSSAVWVRAENDGAGSGFVVDAQRRWVLTCRHVVGEQKAVDVFFLQFRDGELVTDKHEYLGNRPRLRTEGLLVSGKVLKTSDAADLALLELESLPPGVKAIPFAAHPACPGDALTVVGHRSDLDTLWNLTTGPLRATGRLADGYHWRGQKLAVNADVLIGQLPIEEGDSGGPVLNARGELVGMACALRRRAPLAAVAIALPEIRAFIGSTAPPGKVETHPLADALVRGTVWIRPTATEFHLAGAILDDHLILTSARGLGPAHRVGIAFPLRDGERWNHERTPYRDPVGLHNRGVWRAGEVIARDEARDLALIRIESIPKDARPLKLATAPPRPGDAVHAMNHPGGLEFAWVYSAGTLRQRGPVKLTDGDAAQPVETNLFQLPTQAGSPGGPVVNARGELLGVLSAREGAQFVGYAATTDEIVHFLGSVPGRAMPLRLAGTVAGFERAALFAFAVRAVEAKNWRAARGGLERILDPYPDDAEARQLLVNVLLGLNKDDDAAAAVADTLRADPTRWPAMARDLLAQADALAAKYPDSPAAAADWLRKALIASRRAPLEPAVRAEIDAALKRAATAKTDAERLAILRAVVAKR